MHILVTDDDASSRYLLESMFRASGHTVTAAEDGVEALKAARQQPPDLIITDILMPRMDGYQLCREWRADRRLSNIPFIFYSANYSESDDERFATNLGADRFLVKPMDPIDILTTAEELLELTTTGHYEPHMPEVDESAILKEYNARLVDKLERQLQEVQIANSELENAATRLRSLVDGTVTAIAKIVEARDPYTSGHQERVATLAASIAIEMGREREYTDGIRIAGLIHDIGKVYVPAEILTKPRRLTDVEFSIVKMHPRVAYDVLAPIDFPWPIADYVIQHHERLDGSGYPDGLEGEDILSGSRILAVADVVEAMSSHRPYKVAAGIDAALDEIEAGSGTIYDADVASACVRLFRERGFRLPDAPSVGVAPGYSK